MGKVRAKWSQEQLQAAMEAVKTNNVSQREAANRFGIPRRTLRNHLRSGKIGKQLGRSSILSQEQETEFVKRITRFAEIGMPMTANIVRHQAYRYCELNNISHKFNISRQLAGRDWFYRFLKRNPEIAKRRSQSMNPARAQKMNKKIVGDYFDKLDKIMTDMNIKTNPHNLYNMDEKGCRLTVHHQQDVLAQRGVKRVHMIAPEHAENVTIVACCNAVGNSIPPMIIFKGKRIKPEYLDNLPPGSIVHMSPKGFMTTDLFIHFVRHLARFKGSDPALLMFDGASSHLDYDIVTEAEAHNITLFCLPSNTTHELQPLDKSVFKPFESYWDQEVLRFWAHYPDRTITKIRFNGIFSKVWPKTMTPENIISGFRATGIFPFNPSIIPDCAFAPSIMTEQRLPGGDVVGEESDEEDSLPLSVLAKRLKVDQQVKDRDDDLNQSFHELLPTPEPKQKGPSNRRKALNYKAQKVTKDLFKTTEDLSQSTSTAVDNQSTLAAKKQPISAAKQKPATTAKQQSTSDDNAKHSSSWYCPACQTDMKRTMRQCAGCSTWYHEECIGFTEDDVLEDFFCPTCS